MASRITPQTPVKRDVITSPTHNIAVGNLSTRPVSVKLCQIGKKSRTAVRHCRNAANSEIRSGWKSMSNLSNVFAIRQPSLKVFSLLFEPCGRSKYWVDTSSIDKPVARACTVISISMSKPFDRIGIDLAKRPENTR